MFQPLFVFAFVGTVGNASNAVRFRWAECTPLINCTEHKGTSCDNLSSFAWYAGLDSTGACPKHLTCLLCHPVCFAFDTPRTHGALQTPSHTS